MESYDELTEKWKVEKVRKQKRRKIFIPIGILAVIGVILFIYLRTSQKEDSLVLIKAIDESYRNMDLSTKVITDTSFYSRFQPISAVDEGIDNPSELIVTLADIYNYTRLCRDYLNYVQLWELGLNLKSEFDKESLNPFKGSTAKEIMDNEDVYESIVHRRLCKAEGFYNELKKMEYRNILVGEIHDTKLNNSATKFVRNIVPLLINSTKELSIKQEEAYIRQIYKLIDEYIEVRSQFILQNKLQILNSDEECEALYVNTAQSMKSFDYKEIERLCNETPKEAFHRIAALIPNSANIAEESFLLSQLIDLSVEYKIDSILIYPDWQVKSLGDGENIYYAENNLLYLLNKGSYFPLIYHAFAKWRCLHQYEYSAPGNMALIPQKSFNEVRMKCANATLKYLQNNPNDKFAINDFIILATGPDLGRNGSLGNQLFDYLELYFDLDETFKKRIADSAEL